MKHLFSFSIYEDPRRLIDGTVSEPDEMGFAATKWDLPTDGDGSLRSALRSFGADGIELLTGYVPVDESYKHSALSVHLPYATDWYAGWTSNERLPDDISFDDAKYIFYGRDKGEIVSNLRNAISASSHLAPAYGVMHACNANLDEILEKTYTDKDSTIIRAFAEMMNETMASFRYGEPPFRILFENLWWPGLRLLDAKGYKLLAKKIEFENWGICLDTGHLMNALGDSVDESDSIERLAKIFDGYPRNLISDIMTVHLHVSTSAEYVRSYVPPEGFKERTVFEKMNIGYPYVSSLDQHRPATLKNITGLVDILDPDYLTHEILAHNGTDPIQGFVEQRSLFS